MCILLKLHYAKFDVSRLSCSKVIEENPLGGLARPPQPGKGSVEHLVVGCVQEAGRQLQKKHVKKFCWLIFIGLKSALYQNFLSI